MRRGLSREVGARKRTILLSGGWITVTYVQGLIRDVIGVVDGDLWVMVSELK